MILIHVLKATFVPSITSVKPESKAVPHLAASLDVSLAIVRALSFPSTVESE